MGRFPEIKICGVNDVQFARHAEELGVAYLGFIFAEGSPRVVAPCRAAEISAALAGKARKVGVFTSTPVEVILEVARRASLDVVQLHSFDYGADEVSQIHAEGLDVWRLYGGPSSLGCGADAFLLDGREPVHADGGDVRLGGTGRKADWRTAAELAGRGFRVVLAGGISEANAIAAAGTGCAVLDVNSSLETSPGVKSTALLDGFFRAISRFRRVLPGRRT